MVLAYLFPFAQFFESFIGSHVRDCLSSEVMSGTIKAPRLFCTTMQRQDFSLKPREHVLS